MKIKRKKPIVMICKPSRRYMKKPKMHLKSAIRVDFDYEDRIIEKIDNPSINVIECNSINEIGRVWSF